MQRQHINTLNLNAIFEAFKAGVTLPPGVLEWARRMKHRRDRLERYRQHNASYPYASKRQVGRAGNANRYAFQQGPRVPNPNHWTGRHFAHLPAAAL